MKIAVVGSREFKDKELIQMVLEDIGNIWSLVSGGARGVDFWAEEIIEDLNRKNSYPSERIQKIIFKPDWDKYGKSAGFIRNKLIINEADMVLAFWDGKSKGTKHSIDLAIKAGIPLNIYVRN